MTNTICFKEDFHPDRISGDTKKLNDLGITLVNECKSEHSVMWDFEFPEIKFIKSRTFKNVEIDWNDEKDCCDVFFENGVCFGYVDSDCFAII